MARPTRICHTKAEHRARLEGLFSFLRALRPRAHFGIVKCGAQPLAVASDEHEGLKLVRNNWQLFTNPTYRQHDRLVLVQSLAGNWFDLHFRASLPASENIDMGALNIRAADQGVTKKNDVAGIFRKK